VLVAHVAYLSTVRRPLLACPTGSKALLLGSDVTPPCLQVPALLTTLSDLYSTVRTRLVNHKRYVKLAGRLELLDAQIRERNARSLAGRRNVRVYYEDNDDGEEEAGVTLMEAMDMGDEEEEQDVMEDEEEEIEDDADEVEDDGEEDDDDGDEEGLRRKRSHDEENGEEPSEDEEEGEEGATANGSEDEDDDEDDEEDN
jgi:hypothetical protein